MYHHTKGEQNLIIGLANNNVLKALMQNFNMKILSPQEDTGSRTFWINMFCLILFFTSQSTIFPLHWDGSSWVEPVLTNMHYHTKGELNLLQGLQRMKS